MRPAASSAAPRNAPLVILLALMAAACSSLPSGSRSARPPSTVAMDYFVLQDESHAQEVVLYALGLLDTGYRFGGRAPDEVGPLNNIQLVRQGKQLILTRDAAANDLLVDHALNGSDIAFVYSDSDPWSTGAVDLSQGTGSNTVYWVTDGNHGSDIYDLGETEQQALFAELEEWTGVTPLEAPVR